MSKDERAEFADLIRDGSERAEFASAKSYRMNADRNDRHKTFIGRLMFDKCDHQLYYMYAFCLSVL